MPISYKTIIHIPKLKAGQHFPLMFKNFIDLQQILKRKKIKFNLNQRGVKRKCSMGKSTALNFIIERYFHQFPITSHNNNV